MGSVVADRVDCTNPGLSRSPDTQVLDACDRPQHTTKNRGEGRSEAGSAGIPRDVGPEAAGLTAGERLKLRKQKHKPARGRHAWYDANRRVHEVHYLVQLDESSSTGNAGGADNDTSELGQVEYDRDNDQAREELNRLRLSLLQLSLAASVTAELEDLRSDEERQADNVVFGPHDPLLGPADMDREAEKDAFSLAGCLDHTGFVVETAPDIGFFSQEYIEAHPKTLFVYADMAAPDEGVKQVNDAISKDDRRFCKGVPLARVCRPLANTLPYPVCTSDGKALTDGTSGRNKLRFQKVTRRILSRARSNRIDRVLLMPDDRYDVLQDFTLKAPATAAALDAQINCVRRRANNFVPKAAKVFDSSKTTWHGHDAERQLNSKPNDYIELGETEVSNYWGRRSDREDGVRTLQATLKHPIHPGDDSGWGAGMVMSDQVGAYAWGRTHDGEGPFVVCIDEGSTGLPGSVTGYCDISIVMALGLKLNTRHRVKVKTAGADGKECVHMTYGSVRANFTVAGQPLGMQTYFVNRLPGSTGLILGMNEKRRLNIDTVCSKLAAPQGPRLKFTYPGVDGGASEEVLVDAIKRPAVCPLKSMHNDVDGYLNELKVSEHDALQEMHCQIGELEHGDVTLPSDLTEAGHFLNYIESFNEERFDAIAGAVQDMNELSLFVQHETGFAEPVDFEMLDGDEFDALAGEIMAAECDDGSHQDALALDLHALDRGDTNELGVKAIEEVTVTDEEIKELLKDFEPDTYPKEFGICPDFVEKLKKRDPAAEALFQRCNDFWEQSGRCGNEKEMHYDNLKGPEVELKLRDDKKDVSFYHAARYPAAMRRIADEYIDKLVARGFIEPATCSKWVSRLLFVRKPSKPTDVKRDDNGNVISVKDPGFRVCVDARRMNSIVESTHVNLPSVTSVMNDLPESLNGGRAPITSGDKARYMNVCDFTHGFHSLRYKPGLSRHLNTFSSHRGNWSWTVCTQGQQASPSVYVHAVTTILNNYGICAGERRDVSQMTEKGRLMHDIFSRDNTATQFKGTEFEKYGDWSYLETEESCKEDDYNWCLSYVDDTVALARDLRQCDRRAWMLMYVATETGLWLAPHKCHTHVRAADLLGNTLALVDGDIRIYAQRHKVAAVMKMPEPKRDRRQLLSALASASWWRKSIPGFAKITEPLYALTAASKVVKKDWSDMHSDAWLKLKQGISRATCRYPNNVNLQKVIVTDAAQGKTLPDGTIDGGGLGGFVAQIDDRSGMLQPLGFMARPLVGNEKHMSPRELERRAIIATCHAFSDEVMGTRVVCQVRTDHQGLTCLQVNDKSGQISQTEGTELRFLNKMRLDVCYVPGISPVMATSDLLSRNVPTSADQIGAFEGGSRDKPWGIGPIDEMVGHRDDVKLISLTPDDTSKLRLINPDISWDGPSHDREVGEVCVLTMPRPPSDAEDNELGIFEWASNVFLQCESSEADVYIDGGWQTPEVYVVNHVGETNEYVELLSKTSLGPLNPIEAEVKSAPNILETDEITTLKNKITYPEGSFARKIWNRWHGQASMDEIRATNVHFPKYRVRDGLLQKEVLGNNADHVYAIVVPDDARELQRALIKYYHEAAQHPGGVTTWKMLRNKYCWGSAGTMKRQVQHHCDSCDVCIKFKCGNHRPFASPRVTIAAPVPFASISADCFDMPCTTNGYDGVFLVICNWSKYCILIPMKLKGLTTPSFIRMYPEHNKKTTAWSAEMLAYKLYKRLFSIFGLPLHIRTDGQASLIKSVWPHLMKLLGVEQLVGTAMSSSSNGICERKIKDLRRMYRPVMERGGAPSWKLATVAVQVASNNTPNEHEMTPEQIVFSFLPRRVQDLLHDVSALPDSTLKRLLEDRNAIIEEIRLQNADAQQAATEKLMERQASKYRDLPATWGEEGRTFWVWLKEKYYSRAQTKKKGASNKQLNVHSDGPFAVTKVHSDKIHFEIDMPEWMARRKDNRFTIKAIRAIREDHPNPDTHIRDAIEAGSCDDDLEPGEYVVTKLWARRYDDKHKRYEYKVMWAGLPSSEASYVAEDQISAPRLMEDFDARCPRGSTRTDKNEDIDAYLRAKPGLMRLKPSATEVEAAQGDDGEMKAYTASPRRGQRREATKRYVDRPAAPTTTSSRGRQRKAPSRLHFGLMDQRRLHDHLLLLHDFDYELYEEAINDWDHTQRVMKQDYDLDIIEGWSGDYGEITYINIDGNSGAPRHDDGPDGGGAASTIEDARCGASPQPSVGACTISW